MTADFEIPKNNTLPKIRQTITPPSAVNLTSATVKFIYKLPNAAAVERTATLVSSSPSAAAATSFVLEYAWVAGDTAAAGVFAFQWRVTLQDGTKLDLPSKSPSADDDARVWQTFEVTPILT